MSATLCGISGCDGVQSSLAPAGRDAERIADLFWWMAVSAVAVWVAVVALAIYYYARPGESNARRDGLLIVGAGVIIPTAVLTSLLVFGLAMLPAAVARAPAGSLNITVLGEQWWWRVRYSDGRGADIEVANEVWLPLGESVEFRLESHNVIHSFWIPPLGGKMDMIPGRTTWLTLTPTAAGVFRGACAEYCGTSHAWMAFPAVVAPRDTFDRWLAGQAAPAREPSQPAAGHGRDLFLANGCGACHTVRGTPARGVIGPDLTHVGSRLTLGAGLLANDAEAFYRWLSRVDEIKPGAQMPHFRMLPDADRRALAAYLESLQ